MTAPPPTPAPAPPSAREPAGDPETAAAVQSALGAEHAAVWCYPLIAAFLPAPLDRRARDDATAHRVRRDATGRLLADTGVRPVAAEPAYHTPEPVTDQVSAARLAVTVESDASTAWRSVLERCDDAALRRAAMDGLADAAIRGARWADLVGARPLVPTFPGLA